MPAVFGYKCQECGQGTVQETTVPHYRTKVNGRAFVVPDALIGVCDSCGAEHFSVPEIERWERLFEEEEARRFLQPEDLQELRKSLGLTMEQFAFLIGCTRQSLYNWERLDRKRAQSRMADLMIRLVRESLKADPVDVIGFLRSEARESGMDIPQGDRADSLGRQGVIRSVGEIRRTASRVGETFQATDTFCQPGLELVSAEGRSVGTVLYDQETASLEALVREPLEAYEFDVEVRFADGGLVKQGVRMENSRLRLVSPTRRRAEGVRQVTVFPRNPNGAH